MNLDLDIDLASNYKNASQQARVLTEDWVKKNLYCIRCGTPNLNKTSNNTHVKDFICSFCSASYELKSSKTKFLSRVVDGEYHTMIDVIETYRTPDFIFMEYDKSNWLVKNLFIVPNHFFSPSIIEERPALSQTARRSGWIGCNILIDRIPIDGKIYIIQNSQIFAKDLIINQFNKMSFLNQEKIASRGWIYDILNCINNIGREEFTIKEIYAFEEELKIKHPNNSRIKDKIRQQLQFLRDKNIISFLGNGRYIKR